MNMRPLHVSVACLCAAAALVAGYSRSPKEPAPRLPSPRKMLTLPPLEQLEHYTTGRRGNYTRAHARKL